MELIDRNKMIDGIGFPREIFGKASEEVVFVEL